MAIHILNPELEAHLKTQRRNSTIASIVVALLLISLLCLVFYLVGITIFQEKTEPMVTFQEETLVEDEIEEKKIVTEVTKTPAAPSSATSPVISATNTSDFSIPTPDVAVDSLAVDFGESEGFGEGFASGFGASGFGSGGDTPSFSFMGQKSDSDDVCFVIDWSNSMKSGDGARLKLLQSELTKVLEAIPAKTRYQMVFFAGPYWIGLDKLPQGFGR